MTALGLTALGLTALQRRLERAAEHGFVATQVPGAAFVAKPGSHDDGPGHGMFLGPIGGPAFSRDLTGRFSRWHLQPGTHLVADLDAAFLVVHWLADGRHRHAVLRRDGVARHEVSALFPVTHERFSGPDLPFVVTLSAYSPVVPGHDDDAALPVVVVDVHVDPAPGGTGCRPSTSPSSGRTCRWSASPVTSRDRGDRAWPGHHHAGNVNRRAEAPVRGRSSCRAAGRWRARPARSA